MNRLVQKALPGKASEGARDTRRRKKPGASEHEVPVLRSSKRAKEGRKVGGTSTEKERSHQFSEQGERKRTGALPTHVKTKINLTQEK